VLAQANVVLPQKGGEGFVREFIEKWIGVERMTPEDIYAAFFR
jgi:hypothetical protein